MTNLLDPFNLWVLAGTFVVVGCFIFVPYVKQVATWFVTIVHEVGHGFFSILTGGGISGIKLHRDGSGSTTTLHRRGLFSRLTRIIVLFAGYAAPIYLGFALLALNFNGYSQVAFWVLVAIGLLTLVFLRSFFGIIILFCYFMVLFLGIVLNNGSYMGLFVNFFAFVFLIQGGMDLFKIAGPVFNKAKYSMSSDSDFHILEQESWFNTPAQVWYVMYLLVNAIIMTALILLVV